MTAVTPESARTNARAVNARAASSKRPVLVWHKQVAAPVVSTHTRPGEAAVGVRYDQKPAADSISRQPKRFHRRFNAQLETRVWQFLSVDPASDSFLLRARDLPSAHSIRSAPAGGIPA